MEQEIIVKVIGDSNVDLAAKMDQIGTIARADAEPPPPPPPPPPPATFMEVEVPDVVLKPGKAVDIDILGGTSERVHGFNFTIGHSQYMTIDVVRWGEFILNAVGDNFFSTWADYQLGDRKIGRKNTPNLQALIMFFKLEPPITPTMLLIPRDTVIATVTVRLLTNAQIAAKERDLRIEADGKIYYRLDLADNKYGRPLSRCIYTLDAPALLPELLDGKIEVRR